MVVKAFNRPHVAFNHVYVRRPPRRELSPKQQENIRRFLECVNNAWKLVGKLGLPCNNYGLKVATIYVCLKNGADFNKYIDSDLWNRFPMTFFLAEKNSEMIKVALREKVDGELRNIAILTYELIYGG